MKPFRRRWILTLLRYGLCAVAIWYLVTHVSWYDYVRLNDAATTRVRLLDERGSELTILRAGAAAPEVIGIDAVRRVADGTLPDIEYGIAGVVQRTNMWQALLAILLFVPTPLLQSLRLAWMLAIQDVKLSLWESVKLTFAGNFFNFALPGTTGGDLIKAYYITRFTHHKTEAVTTVFLDRVIGLLGLVLLAGVMILVAWDTSNFGQIGLILGVVCGGLAIGALFVFSKRLRHTIGLPQLAARLPAGEHLLRIGRATVAMRQHKGLVGAALLNTIVLQFCVMVSAYVMALALGMKDDFTRYLIYVPIGFLIAAVPISPPQAFGVMEWAYVQFFARTGMASVSQAVAFALAVRVIQLIWSLPGVLVPLLGAHLPTRREMAELEGTDAVEAAAATTMQPSAAPGQ